MKRLANVVCVAAVAACMSISGCSWFTSHIEPVIKPVTTCAGQQVTAENFNRALADLETQNYADLAAEGVTIGWDVLACVIDGITSQNPGLKPAGDKFKSDHAEEIKAARA